MEAAHQANRANRKLRTKFAVTFGKMQGYWSRMKVLIALILWTLLLALCWPLALFVLLLWPLLWLLSIPFRMVGAAMNALVAFVTALLYLPARLLGHRGK